MVFSFIVQKEVKMGVDASIATREIMWAFPNLLK